MNHISVVYIYKKTSKLWSPSNPNAVKVIRTQINSCQNQTSRSCNNKFTESRQRGGGVMISNMICNNQNYGKLSYYSNITIHHKQFDSSDFGGQNSSPIFTKSFQYKLSTIMASVSRIMMKKKLYYPAFAIYLGFYCQVQLFVTKIETLGITYLTNEQNSIVFLLKWKACNLDTGKYYVK